jgi:hypothetical protein
VELPLECSLNTLDFVCTADPSEVIVPANVQADTATRIISERTQVCAALPLLAGFSLHSARSCQATGTAPQSKAPIKAAGLLGCSTRILVTDADSHQLLDGDPLRARLKNLIEMLFPHLDQPRMHPRTASCCVQLPAGLILRTSLQCPAGNLT